MAVKKRKMFRSYVVKDGAAQTWKTTHSKKIRIAPGVKQVGVLNLVPASTNLFAGKAQLGRELKGEMTTTDPRLAYSG